MNTKLKKSTKVGMVLGLVSIASGTWLLVDNAATPAMADTNSLPRLSSLSRSSDPSKGQEEENTSAKSQETQKTK